MSPSEHLLKDALNHVMCDLMNDYMCIAFASTLSLKC